MNPRNEVFRKHTYLLFDTSRVRPDLDTWGLAHKRLVEILNELLEKAGSRERAFGVASHNDASVMLLTAEMYGHLCSVRELPDDYFFPRPTEEMELLHEDYWPHGSY